MPLEFDIHRRMSFYAFVRRVYQQLFERGRTVLTEVRDVYKKSLATQCDLREYCRGYSNWRRHSTGLCTCEQGHQKRR